MFSYKSKIQHVYINYILKKFFKSYKKYYILVNTYIYMYTSYIKMHYYCKKDIAGKKLVLKRSVLHLCNDVRWLDLRLHPQTALRIRI